MRILLLSPYPEKLTGVFAPEDKLEIETGPLKRVPSEFAHIVSFGYKHILKDDILTAFPGEIVNLHIAMLPWNRGSDPNFWSWFDGTPKGVSIHRIFAGIDTGPIYAQQEVRFPADATLSSSYKVLHASIVALMRETWPKIVAKQIRLIPQPKGIGSYHRTADKAKVFGLFPRGWDTPCAEVERTGWIARASAEEKGSVAFVDKVDAEIETAIKNKNSLS